MADTKNSSMSTVAPDKTRPTQPSPPSPPAAPAAPTHRRGFLHTMWGGIVIATIIALIFQAVLTLCLVSANHLLEPHNMPFGQTAPSPVTQAVQSKVSLTMSNYPDQAAAVQAINKGKLYGAYIPGSTSDTLVVVPAKSFFGSIIVEGVFEDAAHKQGRTLNVETLKPLPKSDTTGGVPGLLLLPLLIGGLFAAIFANKVSQRAAARWRVLLLVGYCILGALLTNLIGGLAIGAYSSSHFFPVFGASLLVESAIALTTAALMQLLGRLGVAVAILAFVVLGLSSGGGAGVSLLPVAWQTIGTALPNQHAITLFRNIVYFGGNNITVPLIVLGIYVVAGAAVVAWFGWFREARAFARVDRSNPAALSAARHMAVKAIVFAVVVVGVVQILYSTTYMSAEHAPAANGLPVGVVGSSSVVTQVQKDGYSISVHQYANQSDAMQAVNQARLFGMLVPGTGSAPSTLYVVPTKSDLAPLDLAVHFERAAKTVGTKLDVKSYAPTPLSSGDPYGLVLAIMLVPLLIVGYFVSSLLMGRTGTATAQWRVLILLGFAVVSSFVANLIVCFGFNGYPSGKFWVAWPISALIMAAVSMLASVLQKVIGPFGTLLTMFLVIMLGNPSSGGSNGVPYLPTFWQDLGPILPPRNGYLLLRNSIYFSGHTITQPLLVLVGYLVIFGVISAFLGNFETPKTPIEPDTDIHAAAASAAAAGTP